MQEHIALNWQRLLLLVLRYIVEGRIAAQLGHVTQKLLGRSTMCACASQVDLDYVVPRDETPRDTLHDLTRIRATNEKQKLRTANKEHVNLRPNDSDDARKT